MQHARRVAAAPQHTLTHADVYFAYTHSDLGNGGALTRGQPTTDRDCRKTYTNCSLSAPPPFSYLWLSAAEMLRIRLQAAGPACLRFGAYVSICQHTYRGHLLHDRSRVFASSRPCLAASSLRISARYIHE